MPTSSPVPVTGGGLLSSLRALQPLLPALARPPPRHLKPPPLGSDYFQLHSSLLLHLQRANPTAVSSWTRCSLRAPLRRWSGKEEDD